jgi:hypothetical protein
LSDSKVIMGMRSFDDQIEAGKATLSGNQAV